MSTYSLGTRTQRENTDFKSAILSIAQPFQHSNMSMQTGLGTTQSLDYSQGYLFSHYNMVNLIDSLMYSRFYESPQVDENGAKKLFYNIVYFAYEVAMKNIKLTPANFIFNPEAGEEIIAELARHGLHDYMRKNTIYGQDLQNVMESLDSDFVKYGSCVSMRKNNKIERVPLKSIRITPNAKSIHDAIMFGGYFIIEKQISYLELKGDNDYKIDDIDYFDGTKTFFVRYGSVPRAYYEAYLANTLNDDGSFEVSDEQMKDQVITMSCVIDTKKKNVGRKVIYITEILEEDIIFDEAHYHRVDGRWLGRGAIEVIIEHQIATNFAINEQRKAMLWSAKKIFTTKSKTVQKNLMREAKNGQIFYVVDGEINQIDMSSKSQPEMTNFMQTWKQGANESTFTFEAIAGDTLPSGTPFRLGAMMTNNAMMFYKLKQEKLGTFYRQLFYNNMIPIFKKEFGGKIRIKANSHMSTVLMQVYLRDRWKHRMLQHFETGKIADTDPKAVMEEIKNELSNHHQIFIDLGEAPFVEMRSELDIELTNNEIDVNNQKESLTTLYQSMLQSKDPRAEEVLQKILGFNNISLSNFGQVMQKMGMMQQQDPNAPQQEAPQPPQPSKLPIPQPNMGKGIIQK